jgi:ribose 5-phosphate isomerase B
MKIYIGSDHGGLNLKSRLIFHLKSNNYDVNDCGCFNDNNCDYPDIAESVSYNVVNNKNSIGILICGTGIGMSMAANKIKKIRCAVCNDLFSAEMAKKHNNANILALGARIIAPELAYEIINKFINSEYEVRHNIRLYKLHQLEGIGN